MNNSGLYILINKITKNIYVGISNNIDKRWNTHKSNLMKGYKNKDLSNFVSNIPRCRHHQIYLQMEFNEYYEKYKESIWDDVYVFKKMIVCSYEEYISKDFEKIEDEYILKYREIREGYHQKTNYENLKQYKWIEKDNKIHIVNIFNQNKTDIINMYSVEKISCFEISKIYNTSPNIISEYLRRWNVPMKSFSEAMLGFKIESEKNNIIHMYVNEHKNATEIADTYNTTCTTILNYLNEWEIKTRKQSELRIGFNIENFKDNIIDMYVNKKMSTIEIGEKYDVSKRCINSNLKKWNIKIRTSGETLKYNQTGNKRYNSIYVVAYYENGEKIDVFGSISECGRWLCQNGFNSSEKGGTKSINTSIKSNRIYKGMYFKKYTKEEYEKYVA